MNGRTNRLCVINALRDSTGFDGAQAETVQKFRANPADTTLFFRVGSMTIDNWYPDQNKPNDAERRDVWARASGCICTAQTSNGNWDRDTRVRELQTKIEQSCGK